MIDIPALRAWLADINDNADEIGMVAEALEPLLSVFESACAYVDERRRNCHPDVEKHSRSAQTSGLFTAIDSARGGGK